MAAEPLDPDARPERARAVRAMRNVAAGAVMLVAVAAAAWLALSGDPTRNRPIEISAEKSPERMAPDPDKPNGAQIPHQGQIVYEIVGRDEAEQRAEGLAPAPEQPIAPPEQNASDPATNSAVNDEAPTADSGPVQLLPPAPPPIIIGNADAPPDLPSPPPLAEVMEGRQPAQAPGAPPKPPKPPVSSTSAVADANQGRAPQPPIEEQPVSTAPDKPDADADAVAALPPDQPTAEPPQLQPANPGAAPPGPFRVQLGAVRNTADAQREWRRLRRKHTDVLGGLQLFIQQVNIPGRGLFHRIQAGPLEQRVLAEVVCDQLVARKAACFVIAK